MDRQPLLLEISSPVGRVTRQEGILRRIQADLYCTSLSRSKHLNRSIHLMLAGAINMILSITGCICRHLFLSQFIPDSHSDLFLHVGFFDICSRPQLLSFLGSIGLRKDDVAVRGCLCRKLGDLFMVLAKFFRIAAAPAVKGYPPISLIGAVAAGRSLRPVPLTSSSLVKYIVVPWICLCIMSSRVCGSISKGYLIQPPYFSTLVRLSFASFPFQ